MKSKTQQNIWIKRAVSIIGVIYTIYICFLSYRSVFYDIVITNKPAFCLLLSVETIIALCAMIYSRKQFFTKVAGFILVPALLPLVFLCLGEWVLIVPPVICAVVIFFASGANEGAKTLLGTMFLLIYILVAIAYFIFTSFLSSPAVKETVETGVSSSGKYRYEVIDTIDSSNGSTSVVLEPNDMDIIKKTVTYRAKGFDRTICVKRPLTEVNLEWKDDDLYINDERWFSPSQAEDEEWFEESSRTLVLF